MLKKFTVEWTDQALDTFEETALQIIERWNYKIAKEFDVEVQKLVVRLENNSKLCPSSKKKKIRRCVIHKNTSLVYRIKKSNIELIAFIDNRTDHSF